MADHDIRETIQEQQFLARLFEIFKRLGYKKNDKSPELLDQKVSFQTVRISKRGTFRLVVSDSYLLTYDPLSSSMEMFGEILMGVTAHIVYRECIIEIELKNPQTYITTKRIYAIKSFGKNSGVRVGLPWMRADKLLDIDEAGVVVRVLEDGIMALEIA